MAVDVRVTAEADVGRLPAVERSAADAFRSIADLAWIADDRVMSVDEHHRFVQSGTAWVAVADDGPVGFICCETMGAELHVWELAVQTDWQQQGIGRRLMEAAIAHARAADLSRLTLTTFRDVPWNEPFYQRLGFDTVDRPESEARLGELVAGETARGLPRRCAMVLPLK